MDDESIREDLTFRIKQLLQKNDVKLWLSPYYEKDLQISELKITDKILELAAQYRETVNVDLEVCAEILLELQKKSLQRLAEQAKFQTEGLATIRIKISGQSIPEFSVHLRLSDNTQALKLYVAEKTDIPADKLKLIGCGKILKQDRTLEEQMIKHGSTVLVMILPTSPYDSNWMDALDEKIVHETKKDLELLTRKTEKHNIFSVSDQSGHLLNIPESSRRHLLIAMSLHEKGRSAFKRGTYSLALVFFLEADEEFKLCSCDLLEKVDNYALLNLDIVWCYLHLKSVHYLSNAEKRLQICDEMFRKCYGVNLERLYALKGTCGNESVLLLRLHLLQAILHHLSNRNEIAKEKFRQVECELNRLKVDEEKLSDLIIQHNCSPKEARLGLRASYNDMNSALDFILQNREQRKRRREVEKINRITSRCICENGEPVDAEKVKLLNEMGYTQLMAIVGLTNSNNDMNDSVVWINNFNENLKNLYPSFVSDVILSVDINLKQFRKIFHKHDYKCDEKCILELVAASVGDKQMLEYFPGFCNMSENDIDGNINRFFENSANFFDSAFAGPSTSGSVPSTSSPSSTIKRYGLLSEEEQNARQRLEKDMCDTTDDYLDTTLESEEYFLTIYKSLLK